MSKDFNPLLWEHQLFECEEIKTPTEFAVAISVRTFADNTGYAFPSIAKVADRARCHRDTASRVLKKLADLGLISITDLGAKRKSFTLLYAASDLNHAVSDRMQGVGDHAVSDRMHVVSDRMHAVSDLMHITNQEQTINKPQQQRVVVGAEIEVVENLREMNTKLPAVNTPEQGDRNEEKETAEEQVEELRKQWLVDFDFPTDLPKTNEGYDSMQFLVMWNKIADRKNKRERLCQMDSNHMGRILVTTRYFTKSEIDNAIGSTNRRASKWGWGYFLSMLHVELKNRKAHIAAIATVPPNYDGTPDEWANTDEYLREAYLQSHRENTQRKEAQA